MYLYFTIELGQECMKIPKILKNFLFMKQAKLSGSHQQAFNNYTTSF
jgi:hypothetical protein